MAKDLTPIKIQGANENNLKNIDLEIIPGQLTVFTGLSGAGKSTLLFDVLHAEGQRKYVETFSPYVRQFLETLRRPNVKLIENIRPSIAVEQKNTIRNSRSTVGTMTELCDYFKVWFSHAASLYDPSSGQKLREETFESLAKKVINGDEKNLVFGFTAKKPEILSSTDFLNFLIQAGHARAYYKKEYIRLEKLAKENWDVKKIFVVVDRTTSEPKNKARIIESISLSIKHGHGIGEVRNQKGKHVYLLYEGFDPR